MAMTEERRLELYEAMKEKLGVNPATTFMEAMPPVGWADVATKRDLDALEERIDYRLQLLRSELRAELRSEIGGLRAELHSEIGSLRAEFRSDIGGLRAELHESLASMQRTLFFGMIGAQAAFAGVVLTAIRYLSV
jgi:hypothetical protein